jgi:hypothetical protein
MLVRGYIMDKVKITEIHPEDSFSSSTYSDLIGMTGTFETDGSYITGYVSGKFYADSPLVIDNKVAGTDFYFLAIKVEPVE